MGVVVVIVVVVANPKLLSCLLLAAECHSLSDTEVF